MKLTGTNSLTGLSLHARPRTGINPCGQLLTQFSTDTRSKNYSLHNDGGLTQPGGYSEGQTPDPIPNSAVKTLCAYGTVS